MLKLDIGSGPFPAAGYTSVDAYAEADIKADMWDLPYDDNSIDGIRSVHSLEHVTKFQVPPTLAEWYRVLKPGATILVEVPDLRWVCRNWLAHQDTGWNLDAVFGLCTNPGEEHRTGFNPEILESYLCDAGFVNVVTEIVWSHEQDSVSATASKPRVELG